jgi:hypothetical protein
MIPDALMFTRDNRNDRRIALAILALPFAAALIALLIAAFYGGPNNDAGILFLARVFSYSYLVVCVLALPAYAIGYIFYWWQSSVNNLVKPLLWFPMVWAGFVWFPSIFVPQLNNRDQFEVYVMLAIGCLILGYLWVGIVRLILRAWRGI